MFSRRIHRSVLHLSAALPLVLLASPALAEEGAEAQERRSYLPEEILVSAALVVRARRVRLRTDAWTLVVLGSVITFGLLGLVGLQLLLGS